MAEGCGAECGGFWVGVGILGGVGGGGAEDWGKEGGGEGEGCEEDSWVGGRDGEEEEQGSVVRVCWGTRE